MNENVSRFSDSELKKFQTLIEKRNNINREIAQQENSIINSGHLISSCNKELTLINTEMDKMIKSLNAKKKLV